MRRHRPVPCLSTAILLAVLGLGPPAAADDAPAAPGGLRFAHESIDFGICRQNTEYPAEVPYTNASDRPATDIRVKSDCGCYSAAVSHRRLEPGESGTLTVRFRTLTFSGRVRKKLHLAYKLGSETQEVPLHLELSIYGGLLLRPGRLHFGEVLRGTRPSGSLAVVYYEGVGKPFGIRGVDVAGEPIETHVEPLPVKPTPPTPDRPKTEAERWRGWTVAFTFTKPPPPGVYSRRAVITTTSAEAPRIVVPLTAHVVGKVWVQTHRISLGLVAQGTTKTAWVNFRPFNEDIHLGTVTTRARKGTLKTSVEQAFGSRGPIRRIKIVLPDDAPAGPLRDVIELRTEVPGEEVTEIEVRGRIFERRGD
jgi:hypothetical protein